MGDWNNEWRRFLDNRPDLRTGPKEERVPQTQTAHT
jgi:hypothetical protein